MKVWTNTIIAMFATAVLLTACKKEETPAPETQAPAATTAPADGSEASTPAAPAPSGPGGYVPSPDERYVPDNASGSDSGAPTATTPAPAEPAKAE